jgi:transcriptional regulator with XRE-family HTH domain
MNEIVERLKTEFQDEDYRYAYDEEFSNSRMATQIKVIREQRKLKQAELADLAEMKQSRISALEDINYNSWSISTLRRLAKALGVRLVFGFEGWGELLPEIEGFGRKSLEKPKFEDDPAFKGEAAEVESEDVRVQEPRPLFAVSGNAESGVYQSPQPAPNLRLIVSNDAISNKFPLTNLPTDEPTRPAIIKADSSVRGLRKIG